MAVVTPRVLFLQIAQMASGDQTARTPASHAPTGDSATGKLEPVTVPLATLGHPALPVSPCTSLPPEKKVRLKIQVMV